MPINTNIIIVVRTNGRRMQCANAIYHRAKGCENCVSNNISEATKTTRSMWRTKSVEIVSEKEWMKWMKNEIQRPSTEISTTGTVRCRLETDRCLIDLPRRQMTYTHTYVVRAWPAQRTFMWQQLNQRIFVYFRFCRFFTFFIRTLVACFD